MLISIISLIIVHHFKYNEFILQIEIEFTHIWKLYYDQKFLMFSNLLKKNMASMF